MLYKFEIDGILVTDLNGDPEEPISWDGEEFVLKRSSEYFGFENSYSTSLKFWGKSAQIIKQKYDLSGPEGRLSFKVSKFCSDKLWQTIIDGILNCVNYTYQNGEVSVLLEESDFNRTFKNRMDTVVSLDSTHSLDGTPISSYNEKIVELRSKAIVQYSELDANPSILTDTDTDTFTISNAFNAIFFALQQNAIQDLKQTNELGQFIFLKASNYPSVAQPIFTNANTGLLSNIRVSYKLKGTFTQRCPDSVNYRYSMFFSNGNNTTDGIITLAGAPTIGTYVSGTGSNGFSFDINGFYEIPGNTSLVFLGITISNYNNTNILSPSPSEFEIDIDPSCFVRFESITIYPATNAKVEYVHEAFSKICEITTGQKDCFRSDFFGAGNSQPRTYNKTGCQRYTSITNGINIRQMKQKDGSSYPINISFSELYKAMDAIFCLGMRLEYDESEKKWIVRVEPRSFFFDNDDFITFDDVSNILISANIDNYFNSIKAGYKNWQMNTGQTNGLDEFNTNRTYSILNKNANKQLDISCDAWAGGYPIEFTRRHQFVDNSTLDFETDNDIFVICLNRVEIDDNGVKIPMGSTNESNELFTSVDNLISPETAYNLRISPARNIQRWTSFIKTSLYKNLSGSLLFGSGEGNYLLRTIYDFECDPICVIDEKSNFDSGHNCFDDTALFAPEIIQFEIPCDFGIFMQLLANANRAIRVNCSNEVIYKGFIREVNFKPNQKEGGTAKYTLMTTPSGNGAAFDSGYDVGYDVIV